MIRRDIALFVLAFAVTALVCLLLIIVSTAPAKSTTSQAWRPVPTALFSRWPAPVDAGSSAGTPPLAYSGSRTSVPSILPSGRHYAKSGPSATEAPIVVRTAAIPDYVAEKGVAGISPLSYGAPNDRAIQGIATFYQYVPGQAAAAARLRDVLGPDWRGMVVRVDGPLGHLYVRLTDFESSLIPGRLIDLSSADFLTLCGPLSRGICSVEISR